MTKSEAIREAKKMAREQNSTYHAILANDGSYYVDRSKPMIGNKNGTHDVTRVDPDGYTYYA